MDDESKRDQERIDTMNDKYLTGRKNKGGAAYNILNLQYERTNDGEVLRQRDDDMKVRNLMRSNNIDTRSNIGFNVINNGDR
jgi:hypothetical protein